MSESAEIIRWRLRESLFQELSDLLRKPLQLSYDLERIAHLERTLGVPAEGGT